MLTALLFALTLSDSPLPAIAARAAETVAQVQAPLPKATLQPPRSVPAPSPDLRAVWREHPSIRAGENFRLDFAAKMQLDGRNPGDEPIDFATWEVHRMRVGIEGELYRHIQFSIERELTERETNDPARKSTNSAWKDVYLDADFSNAAQVRVGKFKVPFGLDQTSGESDLDFVYRSLGGNYLSPGRDIGAMVRGRFVGRRLQYAVGGFREDGENSRSGRIAGADTTVAARVIIRPFGSDAKAGLDNMEIGGSFASSELSASKKLPNDNIEPNGLRARTVMSQYTFFDPMFVDGRRRRFGVDLDYAGGPFGARAEYMYVGDTRDKQGLGDENLSDVRGHAWYVLGSWVLTGERKERPVDPRKNGIGRGGVGAVEVAVRYDRLWFDSVVGRDTPFRNSRAETILPNGDRVLTLGLNYYVNRWVKVQVNGIREQLQDIERSPLLDGSSFWSSVFRLQLQL